MKAKQNDKCFKAISQPVLLAPPPSSSNHKVQSIYFSRSYGHATIPPSSTFTLVYPLAFKINAAS